MDEATKYRRKRCKSKRQQKESKKIRKRCPYCKLIRREVQESPKDPSKAVEVAEKPVETTKILMGPPPPPQRCIDPLYQIQPLLHELVFQHFNKDDAESASDVSEYWHCSTSVSENCQRLFNPKDA